MKSINYVSEIESIENTFYIVDRNSFHVRGEIHLTDKDINKSYIEFLLRKTSLKEIIRQEVLKTLNENNEKIILDMLTVKQEKIQGRDFIYVGYSDKKGNRYIDFIMFIDNHQLENIFERAEKAEIKW